MKNNWLVGERITLEPYGEGHVTDIPGRGWFLRVQWPMVDSPQLVTTVVLPKVNSEGEDDE